MLESSQLEKLATPLKWGFLADNLLLLLARGGGTGMPLAETDRELVQAARELLELTEIGVRNMAAAAQVSGDLTKIVESLTLYNYVASSTELENATSEKMTEFVARLKASIDRWLSAKAIGDADLTILKRFFVALSDATLRESNDSLSSGAIMSAPE